MAGGYSIQVCNLSTKETESDVRSFFSHCGTVLDVKMQKAGKKAQVANVTFEDPYASETALLLNGSIILIEEVYIVPVGASGDGDRSLLFAARAATLAQDVVTTMVSKGYTLGKDAFIKARELDEKYQITANAAAKVASLGRGAWSKVGNADVRGMSKTVYEVSKSALATAGETMSNAGSAVVQSPYFSTGAMWASQTLDKAAKATGSWATKGNQGTQ